jgi:hypothetical protein
MPRKNTRRGRSQARRKEPGLPVRRGPWLPPTPVEDLVVPKGRCYLAGGRSGKLRFTEAEAERALRQAQHGRRRSGSGRTEERAYSCDCGFWHLTGMKQKPEAVA